MRNPFSRSPKRTASPKTSNVKVSGSFRPEHRKNAIHLAPFNRNVGDNALNIAIEAMLAPFLNISRMELVANPFDEETMQKLDEADVIIFGGGGVIHSCSGDASRKNREKTGTMWNMDMDRIAALKSKIVLYCVGYNRFQGEPEPLPAMGEFFDMLDQKKALVRFRNDGSLSRYLEYFPRHNGIQVAPDPGVFCRGADSGQGHVLIQIATDRPKFRYPLGIEHFIETLNEMLALIPSKKILIPHTTSDGKIYDKIGSQLLVDEILPVDLDVEHTMRAMDLYAGARFTISTRGHSQICSVGNGTPTFAISTHPKAIGYMVDNGLGDCCYDYLNDVNEVGIAKFKTFISNLPEISERIRLLNESFDSQIAEFNEAIKAYVYEDRTERGLQLEMEDAPSLQAGVMAWPERSAEAVEDIGATGEVTRKGRGRPSGRRESEEEAVKVAKRSRGFVIGCDANYFPGVAGCIAGIRRYNVEPIAFLDTGLTPEQRIQLSSSVDLIIDANFVHDLGPGTFSSHLNKSALSSLFCHLSGFDDCLYIDIDALVAGNLGPMFDELRNADIVGVQGSQLNAIFDGYDHTVGAELTKAGAARLTEINPDFDVLGPAINTGCFAVRSELLARWQLHLNELLQFLPEFKLVDQSVLNALLQFSGTRLKLVDRQFNMMGLQFQDDSRDKFHLDADMTAERCELFFAGEQIRVAHFSGKTKPWMIVDDSVGSLAWRWNQASSSAERRGIAVANERRRSRASGGISTDHVARLIGVAPITSQEKLAMAWEMLAAGDRHAAHRLFADVAAINPNSQSLRRGLANLAAEDGHADEAWRLLQGLTSEGVRLDPLSRDLFNRLDRAFSSKSLAPPATHGAAAKQAVSQTSDRLVAKRSDPSLMDQLEFANVLAATGVQSAPADILLAPANGSELDDLRRKARHRSATHIATVGEVLIPAMPVGLPLLHVACGVSPFIAELGEIIGREFFGLEGLEFTGSRLPQLIDRDGVSPRFYAGEMRFGLVVLGDILNRVSNPAGILSAASMLLGTDGIILISLSKKGPAFTGQGLWQSLGRAISLTEMETLIEDCDLVIFASWVIDEDVIYLARRTSGVQTDQDQETAAGILISSVAPGGVSRSFDEIGVIEAAIVKNLIASGTPRNAPPKGLMAIAVSQGDQLDGDCKIFGPLARSLAPRHFNLGPSLRSVTTSAPLSEKFLKRMKGSSVAFVVGGCRNGPSISSAEQPWRASYIDRLADAGIPVVVTDVSLGGVDIECEFDAIQALIDRGTFFAVKDQTSLRTLRQLLPHRLASKVHYVPSSLASAGGQMPHLVPRRQDNKRSVIGVVFAAEDLGGYYQAYRTDAVQSLLGALRNASAAGSEVRILAQAIDDEVIFHALRNTGCPVALVKIAPSVSGMHGAYSGLDVLISSRAAPAEWATALGVPVVGLSGDPTLEAFFLDALHPGWLIDLGDVEVSEKLSSTLSAMCGRERPEVLRRVKTSQGFINAHWSYGMMKLEHSLGFSGVPSGRRT